MNVVTTVIKSRHSVRKFKPEPIAETVLQDALECAAHAPTAMNHQPWLFGVIRNKDTLSKIAAATDYGKFIADCSVCIAVFGEKNEQYYLEDCSAATENLILALQAYGVCSCWVAGDKKPYGDQIRTILGVPAGFTLVSLVAAGMPAEVPITPKKALNTILFFDQFKAE